MEGQTRTTRQLIPVHTNAWIAFVIMSIAVGYRYGTWWALVNLFSLYGGYQLIFKLGIRFYIDWKWYQYNKQRRKATDKP